MKILVLGANGQVGWEIKRQALNAKLDFVALDRNNLDITRYQDVKKMVKDIRPDIIIDAAAYTAVDKAEKEPETAFLVNRDGPMHLAQICADINIPLLHISTDYVFDGENDSPYTEDDPVNPLNVYGQSKLEGEELVRKYLEKHIILRTSWVFGVWGNNFVKTILNLVDTKKEIKVVADQHGCPTPARDIASTLLSIAQQINQTKSQLWGIYHYCGKPATTWYGMANMVVKNMKKDASSSDSTVLPITTADYPTLARRPKNSVLDCDKILSVFQVEQCDWHDEISQIIQSRAK